MYHLEFNSGVDEIMFLVNALNGYQSTNKKEVRQSLLKIKKLIEISVFCVNNIFKYIE